MMRMRIAWFSPVPPDPSGIAAYSAELVPLLGSSSGAIDLYVKTAWPPTDLDAEDARRVDRVRAAREWLAAVPAPGVSVQSAHDFVWRHRRSPYDLVVYNLGNSSAHDYIWAYLFRYPGLLVLHDGQVHQARALALLGRPEPRLDDYLAEFHASHPDAKAELGYLFAAGLGGNLYRFWPMVALAIRASRLTVVHNAQLAERLRRAHPGAAIRHVAMGVADPQQGTVPCCDSTQGPVPCCDPTQGTVPSVRRRHGLPDDAVVVGAFGGVTPEKRIPELLDALAQSPRADLHALLVGQRAAHYDVDADVRRHGLDTRVHVAGYVADAELPAYLAAADICWCLRWPSNGETSASWLRCLAAGRPTLLTALAQLRDVPLLGANADGVMDVSTNADTVGIAIDPVDERRDVACALDALARDPALRRTLGANARALWASQHTLPQMADAYRQVIAEAARRPAPPPQGPAHLLDDGTGTARRTLAGMGLPELAW
jgi:glycosyltransferase involved in cell wall biosynthesis